MAGASPISPLSSHTERQQKLDDIIRNLEANDNQRAANDMDKVKAFITDTVNTKQKDIDKHVRDLIKQLLTDNVLGKSPTRWWPGLCLIRPTLSPK